MTYNYSVVLPYRDKYDLFLKAFDSIPDREDIQIIIVDNAPESLCSDQVPTKQKAQATYITSLPTKGAGCARNEGLKYVEGKFLLFLDADDYFIPDAFSVFDRYLDENCDIVFFKPTSIRLKDGLSSFRHLYYSEVIDDFLISHNDNRLRYRWEVPWSKLFLTDFVRKGCFQFDEIRVSNDAWFSLMTGHNAKKIDVDSNIVYVVTEGEEGQSLVQTVTRDNAFIRFKVAVRINKFLKVVNHYDMRIRLLGFLNIAFSKFGFIELLRYIKYAWVNKVNFF